MERIKVIPVPNDEKILLMQKAAIEVYNADPFVKKCDQLNVWGRFAIVATLKVEYGYTMTLIAKYLGYTNHGNACSAFKSHSGLNTFDKKYKDLYDKFGLKLKELAAEKQQQLSIAS